MRGRYLEITFRKEKPFAAYLCFPRKAGLKSAHTRRFHEGLLVDYAADGDPIGLEITSPTTVTLEEINSVLGDLGLPPVQPGELAPLTEL